MFEQLVNFLTSSLALGAYLWIAIAVAISFIVEHMFDVKAENFLYYCGPGRVLDSGTGDVVEYLQIYAENEKKDGVLLVTWVGNRWTIRRVDTYFQELHTSVQRRVAEKLNHRIPFSQSAQPLDKFTVYC